MSAENLSSKELRSGINEAGRLLRAAATDWLPYVAATLAACADEIEWLKERGDYWAGLYQQEGAAHVQTKHDLEKALANHSADLTAVEPSAAHVDWLGLALDLETQAKRVESQTAERAMTSAAHGLRLMGGVQPPAAMLVDGPISASTTVLDVLRSVDNLLEQNRYEPESSTRHQLAIAMSMLRAAEPPGETRIAALERALRYWLPDETMIPAGHEIAWNEHVQLIPEHRASVTKVVPPGFPPEDETEARRRRRDAIQRAGGPLMPSGETSVAVMDSAIGAAIVKVPSEPFDMLAALKERMAVPKGHFCRGIVHRYICHNCGRHYDEHWHTDESSTCPTVNGSEQ